MKAKRQPPRTPPFAKVTLVLETQAEVDKIFALINHSQICVALKLPQDVYKVLDQYRSDNYGAYHNAICQIIR